MKRLLFSVFSVLLLTVATAWGNSFEDAKAAYWRGDFTEAFKLSQLSATLGDAKGQKLLGVMYEYGKGVMRDYPEAVKWYRLAALQGYAEGQFSLGTMYEGGKGVVQNYAEAVKWYRLAAVQGNNSAQRSLGIMYQYEKGVSKDHIRAHMWFNISAASGHETADETARLFRYIIEKEMSSKQISKAQKMANDCQQKNFKGCD